MKKYQLTLLSLCVAAFAQAKVTLPSFFTDNMVIQQNSQLTLPGKAKAGKQVTVKVSWNHEKYTAKASADGHFSIEVPTPPAGGPYQIIVSDGEKLVLNNVLSGEVWICSGQSNMEMPVAGWGKVMNYEQEVADANYPSIRLLQVKKTVAFSPQDNVEMNMNGWQECSSATVSEFSSVAYFYARKLWKELNVPVGVIDCTWGGTPAESWTSHQTLKRVMGFQKKMAEMESAGFQREKLVELYHREMDEWLQQFDARDAGFKDGAPQWISALQTGNGWKPMELPAYWETRGLNFDGTVWFQKEVEIPADWSGKEISFHLAMIDDDDITYFNGKEIGRTSGCNTMRTYKISAALAKAGKGVITIRAIDYGGEGGIHGEPQQMYMEANGKKISLAGNWNYHTGVSMTGAPSRPLSPEGTGWPTSCYPTVLYNAMIHPFTVFPIKGAIWYQGENNAARANEYIDLFPALIKDWRSRWNSEFPFYWVQLANFMSPAKQPSESHWANLRDTQSKTLALPHTGQAVIIDIGEENDIHPRNKQDVGKRLALHALHNDYGYNSIVCTGPIFQSVKRIGNTLEITFDTCEEKLVAHNKYGYLSGFAIAGADGKYQWAQAKIENNKVIVWNKEIQQPVSVRYAWGDNPNDANLYNAAGLPASPFEGHISQ